MRAPAPQTGQRPTTHYYAKVPIARPDAREVPCPTRSGDSLGTLFACAR